MHIADKSPQPRIIFDGGNAREAQDDALLTDHSAFGSEDDFVEKKDEDEATSIFELANGNTNLSHIRNVDEEVQPANRSERKRRPTTKYALNAVSTLFAASRFRARKI